ncbi:lipid A deacylase LpxR family protein [Agitococcus lubricus]|uniref:Uncharacterized protein DUF2219 n=1 Tax=Agitococcus lubricus TaxID=1077255 RepID=A0A2T5J1B2_9GAMM|nr:lipid A deacylase LpxR family protein [Agitococcus lubricus]PTQ90153.1 uncharacterized protein DUF2219 [Agitococcus lubricus]
MLTWQRFYAAVSLLFALSPENAYSHNNNDNLWPEPEQSGWSLHIDNDLFSPHKQDRDYTGGINITFAGQHVKRWPISVDRALTFINQGLGIRHPNNLYLHSLQLGIAAFSPEDIQQENIVYDDRPYASLLYLANSQLQIVDDNTANQSTLTVGILGTKAAQRLQESIHQVTGSEPPQGWQHQIAKGGELTLKYSYAHQRLWYKQATMEIKQSYEGSLGFLTEANSAISVRWGRISSPWWSFTPDRSEYFAQPSVGLPMQYRYRQPELYLWAGTKLRVRAYNAFLQGQFRESTFSYQQSELEPLLVESWLGVTQQISTHYRLSWVWRYQSAELKQGHGHRDLIWGSIMINRDF